MDVPEILKPLLFYRQETISHARWLTTASGYLRMFFFFDIASSPLKFLDFNVWFRPLYVFICLRF